MIQEETPEEVENNDDVHVSTVVCNHIGFFEIIGLCTSPVFPGFSPKTELKNAPGINACIIGIDSIWVNRGATEEEREKIVMTLMDRQIEIEDKGYRWNPICVFPEGTTTNGKFLMPFKRGAFQSMRTV